METLPKFRKPPLIEVVHGIQFRQLPMTIIHPGLFYDRIKKDFPASQTAPRLAPARESFGLPLDGPQFRFEMLSPGDLPRAFFVSADDTMVVQLQRDSLSLNWRGNSNAQKYPHFDAVTRKFSEIYSELALFSKDYELGPLEAQQCEMTYVNHLVRVSEGQDLPNPKEFLRVWSGCFGPEWGLPMEDLSFSARFLLRSASGDPYGRVTVALAPVFSPPSSDRMLQLEITARGTPATGDLAHILDFHREAHEQIVRCFAAITTAAKHEEWERFQ